MKMSEMAKEYDAIPTGQNGFGNPLEMIKQFTELIKEVNKLEPSKFARQAPPMSAINKSAAIRASYEKVEGQVTQPPTPSAGSVASPDPQLLAQSFMSVLSEMKPGIEANPLYRNATVLQFIGQMEGDENFRMGLINKILMYYNAYAGSVQKTESNTKKQEGENNGSGGRTEKDGDSVQQQRSDSGGGSASDKPEVQG